MTEHQSIQRWKILTLADENGGLVDYADHVAAVAEAERRTWDRAYAAALDAAREAVCNRIHKHEMLTAIDALRKGSHE